MQTRLLASFSLACLLLSTALATTVTVGRIEIKPKFELPELKAQESKDFLTGLVRKQLEEKLKAAGYTLGDAIDKGYVLDIEITRLDQRNRSPREIAENPGKPQSETTVELNLTMTLKADTQQAPKLKGKAGGAYMGTTDKYELQGSPQDKSIMLQQGNKQRAKALFKAVWNAIEKTLPKP